RTCDRPDPSEVMDEDVAGTRDGRPAALVDVAVAVLVEAVAQLGARRARRLLLAAAGDEVALLAFRTLADLTVGDKRLGRLEAKARNQPAGWQLDSLLLQNPDGNLKGKGEWRLRGGQQTRLDFELVATDAGKLLERLGYPNAIRRGTAQLNGNLTWDGPLTTIHYPSLSGEMQLKAEKGQFAKLEPGIGKLLGLISLQSLPRRLTLDFRDIFSDGLAFDSIESKVLVSKGVMRTVEDLKIDGPAARILIRGETDLKQETQNLQVNVQPEVGGAAAVGIAIANPAIGAAAWVVNKVFQNPLNRMFAFQYHVTGTWNDPKVEKLGQPAAGSPPEPGAAEKGS
ncbi:MAG TPA: AsmA-like C-terminal region-containing protein, partial [Rhodocyclaceae bacterium]|nr:AsmA-like C-terminal region-containing protein [Rhodocyclaceae bacterium]